MQAQGFGRLRSVLKNCVPPSLRFEIRQKRCQLKHFFPRLNCFKWRHFSFPLSETNLTTVHYKGRPENKAMLMALLGADTAISYPSIPTGPKVYVTEHPMRDAICIPFTLITIVKLGRSIEDIVATYAKSLRRSINSERPNYRYQAIDDVDKINVKLNE